MPRKQNAKEINKKSIERQMILICGIKEQSKSCEIRLIQTEINFCRSHSMAFDVGHISNKYKREMFSNEFIYYNFNIYYNYNILYLNLLNFMIKHEFINITS